MEQYIEAYGKQPHIESVFPSYGVTNFGLFVAMFTGATTIRYVHLQNCQLPCLHEGGNDGRLMVSPSGYMMETISGNGFPVVGEMQDAVLL